jgi:predicted Zn-dependent protease
MSARLACAVVLLAGLAAACEPATLPPNRTADVYEFRLQADSLLVMHWPIGATIRVYAAAPDAASRAVLEEAFAIAAAEWNRHAMFGEYRLVATSSLQDADVVLRWLHDPSELDLSECVPSGARAVTTFCLEDPEAPAAGLLAFTRTDGSATNVRMVVSLLPSEQSIPGRVQSLVTHELGHVLGIGQHSDVAADLMAETQLSSTTLTRRDISTIQTLYHTTADVLP